MSIDPHLKAAAQSFDCKLYAGSVFYMAAVLEAVVASTWATVFDRERPTAAYNNIIELYTWGVLDECHGAMANMVRRAGNDVRHSLVTPSRQDVVDVGACLVLLLGRLSALKGPVGKQCKVGNELLRVHPHFSKRAAALLSISNESHCSRLEDRIRDGWFETSIVSVAMGIAARRLEAHNFLALLLPALAIHPNNIRLKQLHAFALGRLRRYDEGISVIKAMITPDDQESTGLAGGIRKREWLDPDVAESRKSAALAYARSRYGEAWESSKGRNTYVGLNYAACSLWAGYRETAAELATAVRAMLQLRADTAGSLFHSPMQIEWDRLNILESDLLAGNQDAATRDLEAIEIDKASFSREMLDIVMRQIKQHLIYLPGDHQFEARIDSLIVSPESTEQS